MREEDDDNFDEMDEIEAQLAEQAELNKQRMTAFGQIFEQFAKFDSTWLLDNLDSFKMDLLKKEFKISDINPQKDHFVRLVIKVFNSQNSLMNVALCLATRDVFEAIERQTKAPFSYKALVDYIYLVSICLTRTRLRT